MKKTSSLLHNSESDGGRICIQDYLETPSKYGMLVQFEVRSRERLAILPITVTCSRSPQHTTCSLHWESGMYENYGRALPESTLDPECATNCVKIELAIWSARSTKSRHKIILGHTKRIEELRRNLEQRRGPQNSWSTSFCSRAAEYNTREQSREVDRAVRRRQE